MKIPFINKKPAVDDSIVVPENNFILHELIPRSLPTNRELCAREQDEQLRKRYGAKKRKTATFH